MWYVIVRSHSPTGGQDAWVYKGDAASGMWTLKGSLQCCRTQKREDMRPKKCIKGILIRGGSLWWPEVRERNCGRPQRLKLPKMSVSQQTLRDPGLSKKQHGWPICFTFSMSMCLFFFRIWQGHFKRVLKIMEAPFNYPGAVHLPKNVPYFYISLELWQPKPDLDPLSSGQRVAL